MKRKASDESPDPFKDSRRPYPNTSPPNDQPETLASGQPRDRVLHPLPNNLRRPLPMVYPNRPLFPDRALPHFQRENPTPASPNPASSDSNNQPGPSPSPSDAPRDPALNSFPNEVRHVLPNVPTQPLPGQFHAPPHHSSAGNLAQTNKEEAMIGYGAGGAPRPTAGQKRGRRFSAYDDSDDEEVPKKEELEDNAAGSTLKGGKRMKRENGGDHEHKKGVLSADGSHGFPNRDLRPFAVPTGGFDRRGALYGGSHQDSSLFSLHPSHARPRHSITTFNWDGASYNIHKMQDSVHQSVRDERDEMIGGILRAWPGVQLRDILPHTQRPFNLPADPHDWCNPMLDALLDLARLTENDMPHAHGLLRLATARQSGSVGGILGSTDIEAASEMRKKEMHFKEALATHPTAANAAAATAAANSDSAFASASTATAAHTATPQAPAPTVTDEGKEMEDADEEVYRPELADRAQQIIPQQQRQPQQYQPHQPQVPQLPRRGPGFSIFDGFDQQPFRQQMPGFFQPGPAPGLAFMNAQHFDQHTPGFHQAAAASGFGRPGPRAAPDQHRQQPPPERQVSAEDSHRRGLSDERDGQQGPSRRGHGPAMVGGFVRRQEKELTEYGPNGLPVRQRRECERDEYYLESYGDEWTGRTWPRGGR